MRIFLRLLNGLSGFTRSLTDMASDKLAKDLDFPPKKLDNPLLQNCGKSYKELKCSLQTPETGIPQSKGIAIRQLTKTNKEKNHKQILNYQLLLAGLVFARFRSWVCCPRYRFTNPFLRFQI